MHRSFGFACMPHIVRTRSVQVARNLRTNDVQGSPRRMQDRICRQNPRYSPVLIDQDGHMTV